MPSRKEIRGAWLALLLVLACFEPASGQRDGPLVLELSTQDSGPYRQVLASFAAQFSTDYPEAQFRHHLVADGSGGDLSFPPRENPAREPSLILALGTKAIEMAQRNYPETPLVATMTLKDKWSRQNAPYAAVTLQIPAAIQLHWLAKFLPAARKVGILYDPGLSRDQIAAFQEAAAGTGMEIVPVEVDSVRQLQAGLRFISRQADVLLAIPDATVYSGKTAKEVLLFSYRHRIPFVGLSSTWVEAGALYALEVDYTFIGRQCAESAQGLLSGAVPVAPSLSAGNVTYTINARTAQYLRLELAPELLSAGVETFR